MTGISRCYLPSTPSCCTPSQHTQAAAQLPWRLSTLPSQQRHSSFHSSSATHRDKPSTAQLSAPPAPGHNCPTRYNHQNNPTNRPNHLNTHRLREQVRGVQRHVHCRDERLTGREGKDLISINVTYSLRQLLIQESCHLVSTGEGAEGRSWAGCQNCCGASWACGEHAMKVGHNLVKTRLQAGPSTRSAVHGPAFAAPSTLTRNYRLLMSSCCKCPLTLT